VSRQKGSIGETALRGRDLLRSRDVRFPLLISALAVQVKVRGGGKRRKQLLEDSSDDQGAKAVEECDEWVSVGGGDRSGSEARQKTAASRARGRGARAKTAVIASDDESSEEDEEAIIVLDDTPDVKGSKRRPRVLDDEEEEEAAAVEAAASSHRGDRTRAAQRGRAGGAHAGSATAARPAPSRRRVVVDSEDEAEESMEEEEEEDEEEGWGEGEDEDEGTDGLLAQVETISSKLASALDSMKQNSNKVGQPACLGDDKMRLKGYQLVGLNWLRVLHDTDVNGILADEMGLGKTIQLISFLAHLVDQHNCRGPHLVICPASVVSNWERELTTWLPSLNVVVYHGSQREREELRCQDTSEWDVVLSTYTLFERDSSKPDRNFLRQFDFQVMALDEAHSIKNAGTSKYRKLLQMSCTRRILLTGTPINNSLPELLVLLQFLMPETFNPDDERLVALFDEAAALKKHESKSARGKESAASKEGGQEADGGGGGEEEEEGGRMKTFFERLKLIVRPFILRRCKTDVLHELVDKVQKVEQLALPAAQQAVYTEIIHRHVAQRQGIRGMNKKLIQNIFAALRKAANHPLLVRSKFSDERVQEMAKFLLHVGHFGTQCKLEQVLKEMSEYSDFALHQICGDYKALRKYALQQDDICASAKLQMLQGLLPQLKQDGHRILIFSQWTTMLDIIEEFVTNLGMRYLRLDGSTAVKEARAPFPRALCSAAGASCSRLRSMHACMMLGVAAARAPWPWACGACCVESVQR